MNKHATYHMFGMIYETGMSKPTRQYQAFALKMPMVVVLWGTLVYIQGRQLILRPEISFQFRVRGVTNM